MVQSEPKWQYKEIDGKRVITSKIVVHKFMLPFWENYDNNYNCNNHLHAWQKSDAGKWITEHAIGVPEHESFRDYAGQILEVVVIARLTEQDQTYFRLRFL